MEITLTTPALLFPTVSLLLLAYTNRFLAIASLIRGLHSKYQENHDQIIFRQIKNLRKRVLLIRNMQAFGIMSLFLCVLCMFLLFWGKIQAGEIVFSISLILMMCSLSLSLWEIQISVKALNLQLIDIEEIESSKK
ncbi:MAG: DUF2721 domain-containing protein [Flammeovirgaceae bacterium]